MRTQVAGMIVAGVFAMSLAPLAAAQDPGKSDDGGLEARVKALEEKLERCTAILAELERRTLTPEEKERREEAERRHAQMAVEILASRYLSPSPPRPDGS